MNKQFIFGTSENADYLRADAARQLGFFGKSLRADKGFDTLDYEGNPRTYAGQELHSTTRLVHSYALAAMSGFERRDDIIDAGMDALWNWHRDPVHGGYLWLVKGDQPVEDVKLAYGHVFVLLAGASAKKIGHPDADRLIADITAVIDSHYWDDDAGLLRDEFNRDWTPFSNYRGMNANMHGVEAFLAAYEATLDESWLERTGRILDFFVGRMAPQYDWRIPEHYDENWQVDPDYEGNPMFRPRGCTPGHSLELGRLCLQYWEILERLDGWHYDSAKRLIETALADAWLPQGGLAYTLTLDGKVDKNARYWWPVAEAIGAMTTLLNIDPSVEYEDWYSRLWQFADQHFIDHQHGGWFPEIDEANRPSSKQFAGKPDLYHALQADLLPLTLIGS